MQPIPVTGILVTGKTTERYPLALRAVDAWLDQNYDAPRELLVINDHPNKPLFPKTCPDGVREIHKWTRYKLGELRNLGIEHAKTPYLIQWDDDDYSDPDRLGWQVANTPAGQASILRYEIHCNLLTGDAFTNDGRSICCGGFPGTMLWPSTVKCRFPATGMREDTAFVMSLSTECGVIVLQNNPTLYTRFFTGFNTWPKRHVMHKKPGARDLNAVEQFHTCQVWHHYTQERSDA